MRIKKFKKNEYIFCDGIWVRNPYCNYESVDINDLYPEEKNLCLENEHVNSTKFKVEFPDNVQYENVIICSDGYDWKSKQKFLAEIPNEAAKIFGTNGALSNWEMLGRKPGDLKRGMAFYVVNNPYKECNKYLPSKHSYFPSIVASTRTYPEFIKNYRNEIYFYNPPNSLNYSCNANKVNFYLDDYRNPICAALSLANVVRARNIILFCCDEAFEDERPNSIKMPNGLYQYGQQILAQKLIDKQLYWLKKKDIKIFDHSSGIKYENAEYIDLESMLSFFQRSENE